MSSYDEQYRIYATASPTRIAEQAVAIERAVCSVLGVAPSDEHNFRVSESSGWFSYAATGQLWTRSSPPTLPAPEDAQRTAEEVLTRLEKACSSANAKWPLAEIALLPPVALIRRAGLHAVARPDGREWDHWLYRAEPNLIVSGNGDRAPVFGAQIEVRLGHMGQVITLQSRWRPLSGERLLADPTPFVPPEEAEEETTPVLAYVLDGESIPQHYLAPYWHVADDDDVTTHSASPWSLTVDIGRTKQTQSKMTLTALAQGGSGDYRYAWAVLSLDDPLEGISELGSGESLSLETARGNAVASTVEVDNGHYIALLNVKDRATGAFKHHQQQVFSNAAAGGADTPAVA